MSKRNSQSMFGIDVDAASYSNVRHFLHSGEHPFHVKNDVIYAISRRSASNKQIIPKTMKYTSQLDVSRLMGTHKIVINLRFRCLFMLSLFSLTNLLAQHTYHICLTNKNEQALVFADVQTEDGKYLGQTGLDGCLSFTHPATKLTITVDYLTYNPLVTTLKAGNKHVFKLDLVEESSKTTAIQANHIAIERIDSESTRTPEGRYRFTGRVLEQASGEPLIGANVYVARSGIGTVTDLDGEYELIMDEAKVKLSIAYIGYESVEKVVRADERLTVSLGATIELDEVVVTAYKVPLIESDHSMTTTSISRHKPSRKRVRTPKAMSTESISMRGSRSEVTDYYVDEEAVYEESEMDAVSAELSDKELPNAGQLTAGEINDFSKWAFWSDISKEDLGRHRGTWQQYADHRYTLQLTNTNGAAAVNVPVELFDGQGNVLWRARTDAQGRAELWAHYFQDVEQTANGLGIRGKVAGRAFELTNVTPFHQGINFHTIEADCTDKPIVDVAFVVDATGSMGDEISYLQAELLDVMQGAKDSLTGADLQLGSVFYRDIGDEYLTRYHDLDTDFSTTIKFVQTQSANGGGDGPEAVEEALEIALNKLNWREKATSRIVFLVLDAPPHQAADNIKRMQVATAQAAAAGIQIIPVACSGIDKSTEYLMRSMALATNGTYTFLTDHSGIGNKHIEPSADSYEVEYLNGVLLRLLIARSKLSNCNMDMPIASTESKSITTPAKNSWVCYPNPTYGPLSVQSKTTATEGFILDNNGKLLTRFTVQERFELDLSTYPSGQYWVKIGEESPAQAVVLVR